jgi:phage tail sheath protein FI
MARLTYSAPGVYVEEVPSAQKPIAGVGTNTAAFIGIVPDEILYPVPNEAYDPQLAQDLADPQALEQDIKERDDEIRQLEERLNRVQARLSAASLEPGPEKDRVEKEKDRLAKEIETKKRKLQDLRALELVADITRLVEKKRRVLRRLTETPAGPTASPSGGSLPAVPGEPPQPGPERNQLEQERDRLAKEIDAKKREFLNLLSERPAASAIVNNDQGLLDGWLSAEPVAREIVARTRELAVRLRNALLEAEENILKPYTLAGPFEVAVEPGVAKLCTTFSEYTQRFGLFSADAPNREPGQALYPGHRALTHAVYGFFNNGGTRCFVVRINQPSDLGRALETIESIDVVAIVAAPGLYGPEVWGKLVEHCEKCQDRFAILDCPPEVEAGGELDITLLNYGNGTPSEYLPQPNKNAAYYFPYIEVVDPAKQLQDQDPARRVDPKYRGRVYVPPSGHIAGIYARTDEERGVHKAPANSAILGALNVKYYIGKPKQELLNPQGVNCIRNMNGNVTVWGARTVGGDKNGEWKYVNVRRLFLFLRESIDEGTQWVVFEPNDPALWGKIQRNLTAFLTNVWRSGALFGLTPEEAFYVKCDVELNPPEVRDSGQVVTEIGVSIVRPAEFVIFRVTQDTSPRRS